MVGAHLRTITLAHNEPQRCPLAPKGLVPTNRDVHPEVIAWKRRMPPTQTLRSRLWKDP